MSHLVLPGSKRSNRQGILRIFRQSVKELGHRSKADAVIYRKEVNKADRVEFCYKLQSNAKEEDITTGETKLGSSPIIKCETSPKKERTRYPQTETKDCAVSSAKSKKDDWVEDDTGWIESTDHIGYAALVATPENTVKAKSESFTHVNETSFNTVTVGVCSDIPSHEDWEEELELDSDIRKTSENVQADIEDKFDEVKTVDKGYDYVHGDNIHEKPNIEFDRQAHVRDKTEVDSDIVSRENPEDIGNLEIFSAHEEFGLDQGNLPFHSTPKKENYESFPSSVVKRELVFDDGETTSISKLVNDGELEINIDERPLLEFNIVSDSTDEDNMGRIIYSSKAYSSQRREGRSRKTDNTQNSSHGNASSREFDMPNTQTSSHGNASSMDFERPNTRTSSHGNASSREFERPNTQTSLHGNASSREFERPNTQTSSHGNASSRKFERPNRQTSSHGHRSSREFERPPRLRFKNSHNGKDKTEIKEKCETRYGCPRYPEPQQRNENDGYSKFDSDIGHRKCGKSADVSSNSVEFRGFRRYDNGNKLEQKGNRKLSLLDLNINTPEKWKNERRKSEKSDSELSVTAKSPWKIPASEDWSTDLYELADVKDEINVNNNKSECQNHQTDDEFEQEADRKKKTDDNGLDVMKRDKNGELDISEQKTVNEAGHYEAEREGISVDFQEQLLTKDMVEAGAVEDTPSEISIPVVDSDKYNETETLLFKKEAVYLPPVPVEITECENEIHLDDNEFVKFDCNTAVSVTDKHFCTVNLVAAIEAGTEFTKHRNASGNIEENCDNENTMKEQEFDRDLADIKTNWSMEKSGYTVLTDKYQSSFENETQSLSSVQILNVTGQRKSYITTEAENSDLQLDESEGGECDNDILSETGSLFSAKSIEETDVNARMLNKDVEQTEFDIERYNYEQYARYWYEQDVMNAGQIGPWHRNYPYNYETYCRWYELKQYEMDYYWEMYYSDMQYDGQFSSYYTCDAPSVPYLGDSREEIRNQFSRNNYNNGREGRNMGLRQDAESASFGKEDERKSQNSAQGMDTQQSNLLDYGFCGANSQRKNAAGIYVTENWDENKHKKENNERAKAVKQTYCADLKMGRNSEKTFHQDDHQNFKRTFNVSLENQIKPDSEQSTSRVNDKRHHRETDITDSSKRVDNKVQTDADTKDTSHLEKLHISCTCKPSQKMLMVWRVCECEAGNPPKLHQILSDFDDRSLDLGYQSYESLECDEPAEGKHLGQKAPGFVIQPLLAKSAMQNCDADNSCASEDGKSSLSEMLRDEPGSNRSQVQPPPGFDQTRQKQRKETTGLRKHINSMAVQDHEMKTEKAVLNNLSKTNIKCETSTPITSLKSLVEHQNRQHDFMYRQHPNKRNKPGGQVEESFDTKYPFMGDNYKELPACFSNGVEHLKQAHMAIAKAEKSQEHLMTSLKSAVDMKINELQGKIEKYSNTEDEEKENLTDSVEQKEKLTDLKTKVTGKLLAFEVNRSFTNSARDILHEGVETGLTEINTGTSKNLNGKTSSIPNQGHSGGFNSVMKKNMEEANATDKSWKVAKFNENTLDESETSGDENNNITVYTQSPLISEDEMINIKPSIMVENCLEKSGSLKKTVDKFLRKDKNGNCFDSEGEIPVNEMLESEESKVNCFRDEVELTNGPQMCYRPRYPMYTFPPPYRGGVHRPPFMPVSRMEQWPMDPRYSLPPPPLRHRSSSTRFPMFMVPPPHPQSVAWDSPPGAYHFKDHGSGKERNVQAGPVCFQPFQLHASGREGYIEQIKDKEMKEKTNAVSTSAQKSALKLVDYGLDSADESSSEIEPFDCSILSQPELECQVKGSTPGKPTPKKLKTDTDDETSSVDSVDAGAKIHTRGTIKLSRGLTKKLKQKSLKSFSAPDRQHSQHHAKGHKSKIHKHGKESKQSRSSSEVIAETKSMKSLPGEQFDGTKVNAVMKEFPPLCTEQKQFSPLPPLPPFPNSPFWSMYTPGNTSALTGNSEEKNQRRASSSRVERRSWEPTNALRRFSYSPPRTASLNSLSETDSEAVSIQNDWRTNFRLFHNFGVRYIDTHCHLDFIFSREGFRGSFRAYMNKHEETFPDTFEGCVAVFCNPSTFTPAGGLWQDVAKEPNVWIAMGCHPKMAMDFTTAAELGLKKCLRHPKCIALGEIGLDYSGTFYQHVEVQKQVFRKQLKMAVEMAKVLVIHCRQAEDDCLEIMKEIVPPKWKIHCHCFTLWYQNAKLWIDAFPNLFIGVTPLVTYKTAKPIHDLARKLPITKLLLETDAPYFVPRCIPRDELPLSNPGLAVTVAKEIAQYQELPVSAVLRQCRLNTNFMYGI